METKLCDGCKVRKPFEHRCHGESCNCSELSCMLQQRRITPEEHRKMISEWAEVQSGKKYKFPTIVEPDPQGDHCVFGQNGPVPLPLYWGTKADCEKWQKENCV